MADFSTIKGFNVETLSSDPYASTVASGTWASGGNMNLARGQAASAGTATAGILMGGAQNGPVDVDNVETYDGTSWTNVNGLLSAKKDLSRAGTQTTAMAISGNDAFPDNIVKTVELYDGTSWTEIADLVQGKMIPGGGGTSTAAMCYGGYNGGYLTTSEKWDGTSWTEGSNLNTAGNQFGADGTITSAFKAGGNPSAGALSETWDGTSWSQGNNINTARASSGATGDATAGLIFAGTPVPKLQTEYYDGTTWSEQADLASAHDLTMAGFGTTTAAVAAGGAYNPGGNDVTEEWATASPISLAQEGQVWYNSSSKVLKGFGQQGTGVWASGGTMSVNLYSGAYCGTQTAGTFTGGIPGESPATYLYDGTSWTTSPATLDDGRHYLSSTGIGTQTAAQIMGGESPAIVAVTEQFDGSTWSEVNDLNYARIAICGAGTQTAGLAMTGGHNVGTASTTYVESWDGTSWANTTAAPHSKKYAMGGGTQTSAFLAGGTSSPGSTQLTTSSTWNGTSWTEEAALNTGRGDGSRGASNGTSALIFGGDTAPIDAKTESWDGTAWTEVADLGTGRGSTAGNGTSMAAIAAGGSPPNTGLTEEWSVPNEIKTFTAT